MNERQESLLQAMEKEAAGERRKLEEAYQKQVQEIKSEAEREVQRLRGEEMRLVDRRLAQERARRIGKAEQEIRNAVLLAKHKIVEGLLDQVEKDLLKLREKKDLYTRLFREMLVESLEELPGDIVVRVNPEDKELCQTILRQQNRNGEIKEDSKLLGGVVLVGQKGRTTLLNSLQSRVKRARELAIEEMARLLFTESS